MSDRSQYPCTDQDCGIVSNGENSRKRRQWVRFVFPNLVTRLSWFNGTETVTHLVSLVNVSASGVAVIMDVKPPRDRPYMILFDNGGNSTGPILATLIAFETTDGGRYLAKFVFDQVQATGGFVPHQKERRAWQRVVPREPEPVSPGKLEMIHSRCRARCRTSAVEGSPSRPTSRHPGIRQSGSHWDQ